MAFLTLDWLHVIALLGAIQGVLLAGVLAARRKNRLANRLLAVTMLAFSLYMVTAVYHAAELERVVPHFIGVAYPLPFLYGPLVYLYAVTAADRERRLTWKDALHFLPFVVVIVAALPIYLMGGPDKLAFFHQLQRGQRPLVVTVADPFKFVSGIVYATITMLFLLRHRERVKHSYSTIERVNLQWLLWLGAGAAVIWGLAVGIEVLQSTGVTRFERGDDVIALAMAILVYAIGYMGLRQPEVFRYETAEYPIPAPIALRVSVAAPVAEPTPELETTSPRYERSGLSDREARRLRDALTAVMERERPWKDSGLTLADLAARLSTTPHKLSEVLNSQLGQTFYDFVNGHRVREVQRRIAAGDANRLTMLSLALDAGFASKSTFNLVFKKHTNQTPSDFRQAFVQERKGSGLRAQGPGVD